MNRRLWPSLIRSLVARLGWLGIALAVSVTSSYAQPAPREQWAHTYGEHLNDLFRDMFITDDGNFAMTGREQMDEQNTGNGWLLTSTHYT